MSHEDSVHYDFETPIGDAEWNATLPSGGVLLHLGPKLRPFSLSMFHQMRCLNIIRGGLAALYADGTPGARLRQPNLTRHCMNYLRQMVLCRADLRLESVRAPRGYKLATSEVTHACQDWNAVYSAAEENYAQYLITLEEVDE
ncbi:hypothetical protein SCP_1502750 [Sparassis crispa]|uniref:Uncharacterized protein n=1 Tax=Sparassis crispa TaxID=139825 RepID=A0A401H4A9_9APHY|nr:hypothetical protein SCP_1502750 [Sparassis crispa]GBE89267.1 hypothetical protein SCP_1502750 [Sparassis crispa]